MCVSTIFYNSVKSPSFFILNSDMMLRSDSARNAQQGDFCVRAVKVE